MLNTFYRVSKETLECKAPVFDKIDEDFIKNEINKMTQSDPTVLAEFRDYKDAFAFAEQIKLQKPHRFSTPAGQYAMIEFVQIDEIDGGEMVGDDETFCGIAEMFFEEEEKEDEE